jgi:Tol biopolymer transport system component
MKSKNFIRRLVLPCALLATACLPVLAILRHTIINSDQSRQQVTKPDYTTGGNLKTDSANLEGATVISSGSTFTPIASNGKIAFNSLRAGAGEIFTMNPDGTNQTNISNNSDEDVSGEWSPDGSKIAFISDNSGNIDIYTMHADGSNQTRLTANTSFDDTPSWSPDGAKIVFASDRDRSGYEIYVMNADGTNQTRLTNSSGVDYFPKFSPDGSKIAFISQRSGNAEIWVMNANGSNAVNLTNNSADDYELTWSPDNSQIAFTSHRSGNGEIWVMNSNGSNPVNLTNNAADDYQPAWSPDGAKIAFTSQRNDNTDIYVMNSDGSNPARLTTDEQDSHFPSWQPVRSNISVTPASNLNITFTNVTKAGYTTAAPLTQSQLSALPRGYSLLANSPMYDIQTSALYSGSIKVIFNVPNIPNADICSQLTSLHYESGMWTANTNAVPVYNGSTRICTVAQTVSSLSPFVVVQLNKSISGRITANGNALPNVKVNLTGDASASVQTDNSGNYSFSEVPSIGNYAVAPSLANYQFTPQSATFDNLPTDQTANFTAMQCSFSISPNGANAPAAGSIETVSVTAEAGCRWTAVSNDNWIAVSAGTPGNGNGDVSYSVTANTGAQRTGTIAIAGQSFIVTQAAASYNISGAVIYGTTPINEAARFVSGVLMTPTSVPSASVNTDSDGAYLLSNLSAGQYTVTPSKSGQANGISVFDATLILRCVSAGPVNCELTANQKIAADTNGDGDISPFDATLILRYIAAGESNDNTGQVGNWKFDPVSRPYQPLNGNVSDSNYTAILVGEVNGSWTP